MAVSITLPQMGESVVEGTVERWLVAEGDHVEKDQVVCEVTTDKVDAEIPAPESGVITRILVAEGTTVDVGVELAVIDPVAQPARTEESTPRKPAAVSSEPPTRHPDAAQTVDAATDLRVSPLARRIAEERGLPLTELRGTGPGGRVLKSDVLDHLARGQQAPAAAPVAAAQIQVQKPGSLLEVLGRLRVPRYQPREGDQVIPFTTIRKRIAEHMIVSKIVSPHVGTVAEVDLHAVFRLRERAKRAFREQHGFNLTYLPFLVQATVRALRAWPRMNATVVDEQIVERKGIHVGVAVETERGLVVPVVRDAERLSLVGLAEAIEELARRARDRQLAADDLHGGTFTVSNPGRQGNLYGFAVINQPQVGILRMGELRKRPVVIEQDGEEVIAIRPMMHVALSYDHRIIDGSIGNGFLYQVREELEAGEFEV